MSRSYLAKKLLSTLLTVFAVVVINFFLFRIMPGDPVAMLVRNPKISPEAIEQMKRMFGLDKGLIEQFFIYVANLFRGEMGMSFIFKRNVMDVIGERVAATLILCACAEVLAISAGVGLGVLAAWKRGKAADVASLSFSLITYSMPTFWLGVLLMIFFSDFLRILPSSGMTSPSMVFASGWKLFKDIATHTFLPALTLAIVLIGEYMLIMRSTLIEILSEEYIVTAQAKGFSGKAILRRHAMPNAMIPMVTLVAMNLGFIITGALQVETIFSWPGLGRLMYQALQARDYPLLQGIFFITCLCVVGANFISDILYGYLDPRVKS